jgi:hypothetical protein
LLKVRHDDKSLARRAVDEEIGLVEELLPSSDMTITVRWWGRANKVVVERGIVESHLEDCREPSELIERMIEEGEKKGAYIPRTRMR